MKKNSVASQKSFYPISLGENFFCNVFSDKLLPDWEFAVRTFFIEKCIDSLLATNVQLRGSRELYHEVPKQLNEGIFMGFSTIIRNHKRM